MKIMIASMAVIMDPARQAMGHRAVASIHLGDGLTINRCLLVETSGGYVVEPPRARRAQDVPPVIWTKRGVFARELADAMADAYEAMTDGPPEQGPSQPAASSAGSVSPDNPSGRGD